ncbi:MAG TPA: hypothetical protein DCX27_12020 [Balneola sp.]|nr:hypothetical protein [Balneola sp.]
MAIGLSAGFIEPLESNGLYTVHEFLHNLTRCFEGMQISQWDKDVFNADCNQKFDTFAQFVSLHYALSHRDDTKYWRDVTTRKYSKEVEELKLSMIKGFSYASASKNINYQFYDMFGGLRNDLPNLARADKDVILLPLHLDLTDADVARVIDKVKKYA